MSEYRDSLPDDETRARYDAAIQEAGRVLAEALWDQAELAAREGPIGVGRAAWYPGHPLGGPEAIAAYYEQLVQEDRERRAATEIR